jgi:hypothetical protein
MPLGFPIKGQYRWKIAHDIWWGGGRAAVMDGGSHLLRVPAGELPLFDARGPKWREEPDPSARWWWTLEPLHKNDRPFFAGGGSFTRFLASDFIPLNATDCLLFILDDRGMTVWRGNGEHKRGENGGLFWEITWQEVHEERFEPGFREPFVVLVKGDTYFIVTESGKLYRAPKEHGKRSIGAVWQDADRPIRAVIDDADAGKVWLFGKGSPGAIGAKDFYFELAEKPEPVYYNPLSLKPVKAEEPLKTVLECAQVLKETQKKKE